MRIKWSEFKAIVEADLAKHGLADAEIAYMDFSGYARTEVELSIEYDAKDKSLRVFS